MINILNVFVRILIHSFVYTQVKMSKPSIYSNFYLANFITIDGIQYKSSEHYFQSHKFIYPGASNRSLESAELIRTCNTPYQCKMLGTQKKNGRYGWQKQINELIDKYNDLKIRNDWEEVKDTIMWEAL